MRLFQVTKNDFIFSNERNHRMARHLSFWMLWSLVYFLLFYCPVYLFKGWGFDPNYAPKTFHDLEQLGVPLFVLRSFIFQSLLSVVVPQAIFTYLLMYWILPNYFYRKRNLFVVAGILISSILLHWFTVAHFKWSAVLGNYWSGTMKNLPKYNGFLNIVLNSSLRDQLSSLPIVAGCAIMIKLVKRWLIKHKEAEQLAKEKNKAELQLLKAQVHPHFLFNTLNNIYFLTLRNSPHAPGTIKKLHGMLHYILHECSQPLVLVKKEIKMIKDYIALEEIRYGDQMKLIVDIHESHSDKLIAPLLLIPFVENSFKHGASKMISDPYVKLRITVEGNTLHFFITNSRPGIVESAKDGIQKKQGQIGLKNVRKRLELLYPGTHQLNIISKPEDFTVDLTIQLEELPASYVENNNTELTSAYAIA